MNPIERLLEHTGELDKEAQELVAGIPPFPPLKKGGGGGICQRGAGGDLARAWRMRVVCEQIRELLNAFIIKMSGD